MDTYEFPGEKPDQAPPLESKLKENLARRVGRQAGIRKVSIREGTLRNPKEEICVVKLCCVQEIHESAPCQSSKYMSCAPFSAQNRISKLTQTKEDRLQLVASELSCCTYTIH